MSSYLSQLRSVLYLVIFAFVLVLSGCASAPPFPESGEPEKTYDQWFSEAKAAAAVKNYDKAISAYESAIALKNTLEAKRSLSLLLVDSGRYTPAEPLIKALLSDSPEDIELREALGIALIKQGKHEEARDVFLAVDSAAPGRVVTLNYLGVTSDLRRQYAEAEKYYMAALAVSPKDPDILNNYGFSKLTQNEYEEAGNLFELALVSPGGNTDRTRNNLAITYAREQRYDEALKLLSSTGDDPVALNNIGYIALLNKDFTLAVKYFEKAMELSPDYYEAAAINLTHARDALDALKARTAVPGS